MDKFSADKLDNLFKEQFSDVEIPLEEDYWPGIEKGLGKISFYKFGWKHINIYNLSLGALALLIPVLYVTTSEETSHQKNQLIITDTVTSKVPTPNIESNEPTEVISPKPAKASNKTSDITPNDKIVDSVVAPVLQPEVPVQPAPEPAPPVVEEKPKKKQKQIIYVVQQDTIIQKDTVKVRRKKKN